jgi:signal transduction histidine kinase
MSLAGQMISLLLLALAISQGLSLLIYHDDRAQALRKLVKEEFLGRTASVVRLLESTPESLRAEVLRAGGSAVTRYWIAGAPSDAHDTLAWQEEARAQLLKQLPAALVSRHPNPEQARFTNPYLINAALAASPSASWEVLSPDSWPLGRPASILQLDDWNGWGLQVQLRNGSWMHAVYAKPASVTSPQWQSHVSLAITAITLSLIALFIARRITQPLRRLAWSAERLGRGEEVPPLPKEGPMDVRCTAMAFNRMQERLRRFVEDRTRMLAAIGHDLRTPITSLRLRAEFVNDEETRQKILSTLDEMQSMTEATLAFVREDAVHEATRNVDLAALLESLCADLADMGWDVTFSNGEKMPYRCRPDALRRAFRNVIENAVRYGERARVSVGFEGDAIEITVNDDGPGIPEQDFERVFAPFVRLESSRNRATGGVGLGLSIARTIVRGHGGDITLANRGSGLCLAVRLPRM